MGGPLIFLNLKGELGRAVPFRLTFFVLGVEILAEKIRKNETIKGITVSDNEIKVSQLNNRKTEALWIGACEDRGDKLCPGKNLKWIKHKGKALGVWFSTNPEEVLEANYADKLAKVSNSLGCWELQRLSLLGKITVLKSLIVSQLVYIFVAPPNKSTGAGRDKYSIFQLFMEWQGR